MPKITIATVTSNRDALLKRYLESLVDADCFQEVENLILLNGEDKKSEEILVKFCQNYKNISFIKCLKNGRGETRNTLIHNIKGEYLYFLDDDVLVDKKTISILLNTIHSYPDVDIFGGPNLTKADASCFQVAQGYALSSFFGTLLMSKRYKKSGKEKFTNDHSLILCNLAFRSNIFKESNILFNPGMVCAEENLLLNRLIQRGYKAMHVPELVVYHERRRDYPAFFWQIFNYGKGRSQAIKHFPSLKNFIYFIPGIFLLYLISLIFIHGSHYLFLLVVYLFLCFIFSLAILVKSRQIGVFFLVPFLFSTIHIAYALGIFYELFNYRVGKK